MVMRIMVFYKKRGLLIKLAERGDKIVPLQLGSRYAIMASSQPLQQKVITLEPK